MARTMNAISLMLLSAILFTAAAIEASPPAAPQAKQRRSAPARRNAKAAARPARKAPPKRTAQAKPRLTPPDASGLRGVRPGTLKAMAFAVMEKDSVAEQQKLEAYGKQHARETSGVLARLV